ncbi:short-chain dehydrogenase [Gemmobacter aquarius]|uniref:Short-chain dehydrogenase n=1 Tax=Paragemmobacter aquarius TaxID=2169400 RepID=A0A2S0UQ67_9RHOB|nr:SDR family NAD(P)-dependent oxidoreductase [Gemmobacter aquarius]AWB49937.1 short-chain dehydrogenase [Gemmobacter aquarius]
MKDWAGKRYWLVGASEGLGLALAERLNRAGCEVVLSARSTERLDEAVAKMPGKARAVAMDVGDSASVLAAAEAVGAVDGVVFLAGVYWPMTAKEWDTKAVETMIDVNLTGAARVVGAVLPAMLARGHGHIVLTGSLSGFRGLPRAIGYGASKAGLVSLAESLRCDLAGTGVEVQLANPGFIRTRLTDKNSFNMPQIMEPEAAAVEMVEHMQSGRFSRSFPVPFAWVFRLSQLMPDWLYFSIFSKL